MCNNDEIEIIFDETTKTYHAFWCPPKAIGAGDTELAALRDMQEAIHFCVDTLIESRYENVGKESNDTDQAEITKKTQKINSLLPQNNCKKCGFDSCQQLALAVVKGKAAPNKCRKISKDQIKKICQIADLPPLETTVHEPSSDTPQIESNPKKKHGFRHERVR
jgi:predicted RNase H-like HicB family nuclease